MTSTTRSTSNNAKSMNHGHLPWLYSAVVATSLIAGCLVDGSAESVFCLGVVGALVAGFVVVGARIGLWRRS